MKKTLLAVLALTLMSCASMGLPPDATQAEKNAARCKDAQLGLAIVTVALAEPQTADGKAYWDKYLTGVQVAIKAYCM